MISRPPEGGGGRRERLSALLRSFAIQGSWNYRTLVGAGLAHALLPLLRSIHRGDPVALREALERHASTFNAHPYLGAVAVGALARLETEGRDAAEIVRFRAALAGPLGALGDRLVWSGWRPACALSAAVAWAAGLGAGWSVGLFLALYNLGHLGLRIWGFRLGWRAGFEVGGVLRGGRIAAAEAALPFLVAPLLGAAAAVVSLRIPGGGGAEAAAGAAVATTAYLLPRFGELAALPLLVAAGLLCLV